MRLLPGKGAKVKKATIAIGRILTGNIRMITIREED
jgi:hypothetical protein